MIRSSPKAGNRAAADRILEANLRHLAAVALRYRFYGVPLPELLAQGALAQLIALDRFDPERGVRFATYASHWVRAEMLAFVLRNRCMVGGGRGPLRSRYVFRLRREHRSLMSRLGESGAVLAELAQRFGRTPDEIAEILARIESRDVVPAAAEPPGWQATSRSTSWRPRSQPAVSRCWPTRSPAPASSRRSRANGPFTVFAPTDDAFEAFEAKNPGVLEGLTVEQLTEILTYHVIAGDVASSALVEGGVAMTVAGSPVAFELEGGATLLGGDGSSAAITMTDQPSQRDDDERAREERRHPRDRRGPRPE